MTALSKQLDEKARRVYDQLVREHEAEGPPVSGADVEDLKEQARKISAAQEKQ